MLKITKNLRDIDQRRSLSLAEHDWEEREKYPKAEDNPLYAHDDGVAIIFAAHSNTKFWNADGSSFLASTPCAPPRLSFVQEGKKYFLEFKEGHLVELKKGSYFFSKMPYSKEDYYHCPEDTTREQIKLTIE
ncbi:MAG: hypothetical protein V3U02_11345 [Calditrichia bacterium]